MHSLFIEFHDPLFSILILFWIIFTISLFSYWWGRYRKREDYRYLDRFLEQFHTLPPKEDLRALVRQGGLSVRSWLFLADAYARSGEYERAIEIYSEILRLESVAQERREIMFLLGKTYFKAGFLGRSRDVFLEILKKSPRTPQVLRYLVLVYEYMRDYQAALEVLEPLDLLGEDIAKERCYLELLALLQDPNINTQRRKEEVLAHYKRYRMFDRMVFEYLFSIDAKLAWESIELDRVELLADILWQLDRELIDLDIIARSEFLKELYSARGYVKEAKGSKIFELDLLIRLPQDAAATIGFEYICKECKMLFPIGFHRCSNCHALQSVALEYTLVRSYERGVDEAGDSFL